MNLDAKGSPVALWTWPLYAFGVAIGSLLILLLAIPEIFVPDASLGWVDAWYYVSFTKWLPQNLRTYSSLYQSDRISWTLPGYVANQIVHPLAANYMTKGAFFIVGVVFLFGALRQICSLRGAIFVSTLAALYSYFVHSLGANHVDGAANVYFVIAAYFTVRALQRETSAWRNGFVAGAAYLAVVLTHFIFVVILPLFAAYIALSWMQTDRSTKKLITILFSFVAGAGTAYASVAVLYRFLHVAPLPLARSLDIFTARAENPLVWPSSTAWLVTAFWLVVPTAVVIWVLLSMVRAVRADGWQAIWLLPPIFSFVIMMYGWMIVMFILRVPLLTLPFYASYLIPPTFLALGPMVTPVLDRLSRRAYWCVLTLYLCFATAAYRLSDVRFETAAAIVAVAFLLIATVLYEASLQRRPWPAVSFPLVLVLGVAAVDFASADYNRQLRNAYKYSSMARIYAEPRLDSFWTVSRGEAFEAAITAAGILRPRLSGKRYYFWYDGGDRIGLFFRSIGSLFFAWSTNGLLNERFPHLDDHNLALLVPQGSTVPRDLLVLTPRSSVFIADSGVQGALQWSEELRVGATPFFAHYFAITLKPDASLGTRPDRSVGAMLPDDAGHF